MHNRQTRLPIAWLFTDERMGDQLWAALARLPRSSGIVFRHYHTPAAARKSLFRQVKRIARANGNKLLLADSPAKAQAWGADGAHCTKGRGGKKGCRKIANKRLTISRPVHNVKERRAALAAGADLIFVSPVFATRSHPGETYLGKAGFAHLAHSCPVPVIALGGMTEKRFAFLPCADGWAAIDYWLG
jgi:thiamine-phosphate pyrophosphorylase